MEAVIETTNRVVISEMRQFVSQLAAEAVTPHYAWLQAKHYRPHRFGPAEGVRLRRPQATVLPGHSPVKVVQLERREPYTLEEQMALERGEPLAKHRLRSTRISRIDDFQWPGKCRFMLNDMLIQVTKEADGRTMVSPPERVINIPAGNDKAGEEPAWFATSTLSTRSYSNGSRRSDHSV